MPEKPEMLKCAYVHCNVEFSKRGKKRFCCTPHRAAQFSLDNPRINVKNPSQEVLGIFKLPVQVTAGESKIPTVLTEAVSEKTVAVPLLSGHQTTVKHDLPMLPDVPYGKKKNKRVFHYTDINGTGKRVPILIATLELLMKSKPTALEINTYTGSTRGPSDVSELRRQGFDSICLQCGTTGAGLQVNRFELTEAGMEKAREFFRRRQ